MGKVVSLITSEDVLHRWRLPSIGVKTDANPGTWMTGDSSFFIVTITKSACNRSK